MVNHDGSSKVLRFMRCVIAEETYCLNMSWVRGIQRTEQFHQQQGAEGGVIGWYLSSSSKIPVFRLAAQLHRPYDAGQATGKIVVLNTQPQPWALLVERIESVMQVSAADVLPLPALARNPAAPFFDGVVKSPDGMMLSLVPEGLRPHAVTHAVGASMASLPESFPPTVGTPAAAGNTGKIICFSTADDPAQASVIRFGLSVSQVPRILPLFPLLPVPGAAAFVLGLVDWQGYPLVVIDLSRRLGGAASPVMPDSRLLIARASTRQAFVSFPVRPQVRVRSLPIAHQLSARALPLQEALMRGRFDLTNETLIIPDIDSLLAPQEKPSC
jgi:purine-binding chemotaxis protein CheW